MIALIDETIGIKVAMPASGSLSYRPFRDMAAYQPINIKMKYLSSSKEVD
jgi:hypothetical protein